jgi:esterase/lipase
MDLDFLVFPTPDSSYTYSKCESDLLYVPRFNKITDDFNTNKISLVENEVNNNKIDSNLKVVTKKENSSNIIPMTTSKISHIPCMYLKANTSSSQKFAIFFHGNAEDINLSFEMLKYIRYSLGCNVISPEYPGYGIYPGIPSQEGIYEDALIVYDFLTKKLKIPDSNIILFGRSLGTSPSCFLASKRPVAGLVLISPMYSIRKVVEDILGKFVSYFMNDKFENYKYISNVKSPILIIHGQNDALINYSHSTELYNLTKTPCELILPENMDHNEFDFYQEFSEPLVDFISRNCIFSHLENFDSEIDNEFFETPADFKKPFKQWNCLTTLLKKLSFA